MLSDTIKASFELLLTQNGTEVKNLTKSTTFSGLVTGDELGAVFNIGDQDLSSSCQVTTWLTNKPTTGDKMEVNKKTYTVKSLQDRVNSPLVRIFLEA